MDATFALLEIYRVAGKIPVDEPVTPRMEVEALLTDGRARHDEGPERTVEGCPHRVLRVRGAAPGTVVVGANVAETDREVGAHLLGTGLASGSTSARPAIGKGSVPVT